MSFYLIALVAWMSFAVPPVGRHAPSALVREVGDLLAQKQYTEAYQRLAADPSFLARVLAAGVRKLPAGPARGAAGDGDGQRRRDDGDGAPHHLPGHRRHARAR